MIRIKQLKIPIKHTEEELLRKAARQLKIPENKIEACRIVRRSIDARKKPEVCYVYTLDIRLAGEQEQRVLKKVYSNNIMSTNERPYAYPQRGNVPLSHSPVIVGSGPAGLFCAYALAEMGYRPIVIERGKEMAGRKRDVELFWRENRLNPESNVQFGAGGAGTFSDGKLNTLVKDEAGRSRKVLETFIKCGAPEEIAYDSKPHIGTDILSGVIENLQKEITALGGTFLFETCLTGFVWEKGKVAAVRCRRNSRNGSVPGAQPPEGGSFSVPGAQPPERGNFSGPGAQLPEKFTLETEVVVLAIGHSARDTFQMLYEEGFAMEAKSFAVGLRVEHPQSLIDERQYGREAMKLLGAAPYKLTAKLANGRGVYSFCMCPGGYVVNASSEPGRLAVNGMSYSGRRGQNANSAIIVTVNPEDFQGEGPLAGVEFQRRLEERAFRLGNGRIPQQLFGDFEQEKESACYGSFESCAKGQTSFGSLHRLFDKEIKTSFAAGMHRFGEIIRGFDRPDCILSGVESRTSSPVRILRDETFVSSKGGVYPCGEGAGYAGGIMSAGMDGLKAAEAVIRRFYRKGA